MKAPSTHAPARSSAGAYADRVLRDLGIDPGPSCDLPAPHPDADWARSGAQWLTGSAKSPPLRVDPPVAACARGVGFALGLLSPSLRDLDLDAPALLGERAALGGLARGGRTTVGGQGRLLRAKDGWLAVQLPRPEDVAALPAWLEAEPPPQTPTFEWIAQVIRPRRCDTMVERARWLGLAVSHVGAWLDDPAAPPHRTTGCITDRPAEPGGQDTRVVNHKSRPLRVLDLSMLWAGPLCGDLLARAGADVVKIEHARRPDGARLGTPRFFDALNAHKSNASLDATDPTDRARLLDLMTGADIVIESARPRGLAQLGIDAGALVDAHPGLTWISITGYGRTPPADEWIAFGDDAAAAAGLVARDASGAPVFCADAVADPLTGLHATLAALAGARTGGGLFDVSLAGVAKAVSMTPRIEESRPGDSTQTVEAPRARRLVGSARPVGADTHEVLARWAGSTLEPGRVARC